MGQYLHLFETEAQFDAAYNGENYLEPWVSLTEDVDRVDYNKRDEWEYVDLGLPSGTLWAIKNLGADSPEDYGDYYAWGEVETKDTANYTRQGYRFYPGNDEAEYTKYNSTDNKMTLDLTDDVANVVMGGEWHMPSRAQLNELTANTTSSWTTDYNGTGVAGAVFTSSISGNSIFFPAAGGVFDGSAGGQSEWFDVWSSSRSSDVPLYAWDLDGDSDTMGVHNDYYRCSGLSVRGVLGELNDEEGGGTDPSNPLL